VLGPQERVSEILFGLIMVLTITGSLSVAEAGESDVRTMLIAAIGSNTAWGIVDAVMYLIDTLVERYRTRALLDALRTETDSGRAREMIAARLPPVLAQSIRGPELDHLRQQVLQRPEGADPGLTGRDLLGALGVFLLVFLSTVPVVLPFLFPLEPRMALRISNGVAIALLFLVGYRVGKFVSYRPLVVALTAVALGGALVVITIALGG